VKELKLLRFTQDELRISLRVNSAKNLIQLRINSAKNLFRLASFAGRIKRANSLM